MQPSTHSLSSGDTLVIREAEPEDARAVLEYVHAISAESEYLTFGPGEFDMTEPEEAEFLHQCRASDNQLYLLGWCGEELAAGLHFAAGRRPRTRHSGEFGMSVRLRYWGQGIGALMLDALLHWARQTGIVTKINLRVRTDNPRAIRLYESRGFAIEGTLSREILLNGRYFDHHCMGLEL